MHLRKRFPILEILTLPEKFQMYIKYVTVIFLRTISTARKQSAVHLSAAFTHLQRPL
jgi:fibrillarin-like rRNA methylase